LTWIKGAGARALIFPPMSMNAEEAVCELQRPIPPRQKLLLYLSVVLSGAFCVFFVFAAWLAVTG